MEPPYEVAMYLVLPVLYLIGKAYGVRGILALWSLAVVAGITQPTFPVASKSFSMPLFHCRSRGLLPGLWNSPSPLLFIGWPLTLVAAAGILIVWNPREYS